jgi:hypothetical protein
VSGNFGGFDTGWPQVPTAGAWHHVVVTYDGTTLLAYLDGALSATHVIGTPLVTVQTLMQVGSAIAGTGVNGGNDPFHGYIADARVESGVLTAGDVAANYAMGPLASAVAATPTGLTATAGDGRAILTWNPSGNATSYNLKRATMSGGPYTVVASNITDLSFTNSGLANGTVYYFVVTATNAAGESADSAPIGAQPLSIASPQLTIEARAGQLQITWPPADLGWTLQTRTNGLASQSDGDWTVVAGSDHTNQMIFPIITTAGSVYFRLSNP